MFIFMHQLVPVTLTRRHKLCETLNVVFTVAVQHQETFASDLWELVFISLCQKVWKSLQLRARTVKSQVRRRSNCARFLYIIYNTWIRYAGSSWVPPQTSLSGSGVDKMWPVHSKYSFSGSSVIHSLHLWPHVTFHKNYTNEFEWGERSALCTGRSRGLKLASWEKKSHQCIPVFSLNTDCFQPSSRSFTTCCSEPQIGCFSSIHWPERKSWLAKSTFLLALVWYLEVFFTNYVKMGRKEQIWSYIFFLFHFGSLAGGRVSQCDLRLSLRIALKDFTTFLSRLSSFVRGSEKSQRVEEVWERWRRWE